MKKDVAADIVEIFNDITREIDRSIYLIMDGVGRYEEFDKFRKVAGKLMGDIFLDVLSPIYEEYPDMMPPELRQADE